MKRKEIALKALEDDVTPLDAMLIAMKDALARKAYHDAAQYGSWAAPYVHPRLASVQHSGDASEPLRLVVATGIPDEDGGDGELGGDDGGAEEDH